MKIIKRDGKSQAVSLDKLKARLLKLAYGLNTDFVDTVCDPYNLRWIASDICLKYVQDSIAEKTVGGLCRGTSTADIDTLAAQTGLRKTLRRAHFLFVCSRALLLNCSGKHELVAPGLCCSRGPHRSLQATSRNK